MKRGFTLVEMLGVLVILSILFFVSFTPLTRMIKSGEKIISDSQDLLIKDAIKDYYRDNINSNFPMQCIELKKLVDEGYIDEKELNNIDLNQNIFYEYYNDGLIQYSLDKFSCDIIKYDFTFELKGKNEINIQKGNTWTDPGFTATHFTMDLSSCVNVKYFDYNHNEINSIDSTIETTYFIEYKIKLSNDLYDNKTLERIVNVVASDNPTIIHPGDTTISSSVKSFNIMDGVSAKDRNGKTLNVIAKTNLSLGIPGEYSVTYSTTDDYGNSTSLNRKIIIGEI